jgi:hypothetical protein
MTWLGFSVHRHDKSCHSDLPVLSFRSKERRFRILGAAVLQALSA